MPRDIPLSNGNLLVTFDCQYRIRDFYYPHVGQENHAGTRPFHFGVWLDGRLSWVHGPDWTRSLAYEPDTLVSHVELRNASLQLEMVCSDTVEFHRNAYLRRVVLRNLAPTDRVARVYFHLDFSILGNDVGDTAFYDPKLNAVIHYKGPYWFLADGRTADGRGMSSFATGVKNQPGFEGTFRDAEDGVLSRHPIAQGSVDSIAEFEVRLPASGETELHYWILAGKDYDDVASLDQFVLARSPAELMGRTRDYWRCWAAKETRDLSPLPEAVARLFKVSLLVLRTQIDAGGTILAANDSDFLHFSHDTYSYCWPRDGSLVCRALDLAGYGELSQKFFLFCRNVVRPEGYLLHKYNPDGTFASSWLPWTHRLAKLPIQEDESALVIWALWEHYKQYRDIEFLRPLYRPLVVRVGDFLADFRDRATGLPLPSWDLWEERCAIHAFTCGAVHGGLDAAKNFAEMFGTLDRASVYAEAMKEVRRGLDEHMYCPDLKRFVRSLTPTDKGLTRDTTLDSSIMGLSAFGAYPADDPRIIETLRQVHAGLAVKTKVGGLARYENDYYFRVSEDTARVPGNPWFICTLWEAMHRIPLCRSEEQLKKEVRSILVWTAEHALPSGILAEQIHPETGAPLSVSPLTWSHATFVHCVLEYLRRLREVAK
jgi:GH15 family glucan-1,4-alpha-glucosidase